MTRIKEPTVGISELPNYKSPPARIVRSLRKGYDNIRGKLSEKSAQICALKGKLRDTQNSREEWKTKAKEAELKMEEMEETLQNLLKKRG